MIRNIVLDADAGGLTSNAFLVDGERPVLVDTGSGFDAVSVIEEHVDDIDAVILTHTHHDHIGNLDAVTEHFQVDAWGFNGSLDEVDREFDDGDTITMGDATYDIMYTPGHKNDHVCFYDADDGPLFAGDLVFANGGFGRTDLAEGDREQLIESIERVLNETEEISNLLPGHGPRVSDNSRDHIERALLSAQSKGYRI